MVAVSAARGTTPRGRPREVDRAARRDALLETAMQIFLVNGYGGTSIEQIASEARVAKRTVYTTLGDKADLFIAVVRRLGDRVVDSVAQAPDDLRGFCVRLVEMMLSDQPIGLHRLVIAEATNFPDLAARLYANGPQRYIEVLAAMLARVDPGRRRFEPTDPAAAAEQLFTLLLGERQRRRLFAMTPAPTTAEVDAHVTQTLALFVEAPVSPSEPPGSRGSAR